MNSNLVSIIVPIYNGEKYIDRCFKSIFSQTISNFEIIAIDDGSFDGTLSILKKYESERVKIIHTVNKGVSHARNIGLKSSSGEYIMFVDVDDELRNDALEILLKLLLKYNADISAGSKIYLKYDGTIKNSRIDKNVEEIWDGITPLQKHVEDHIAGHSVYSKLYKKQVIDGVYFEESRRVNEDSFFSFQCFSKAKKMVFLDVGIYRYYETPNSASRSEFSDKFFDILYFANKKVDIIKSNFPELQSHIPSIVIKANIVMLVNLCKTYESKYRESEKNCIKTIKLLSKTYTPVFSYEKKIIGIVNLNLFQLYKIYSYFRFYSK